MITDKHVLIVEDEFLIGTMIADFLKDFGALTIGPVETVAEALTIIGQQPIDIAVIDWNLRGESGSTVANALRASGIPFLISTGYGKIEAEFADIAVLRKPYGPHVLAEKLRDLLAA